MFPSYHPYHRACSLVIPPASFLAQEHFGYAFTVVASRKGGAVRDRTPPLQQLRRSLVYLGAKYSGLLVCGEPVADTEKEQRHWLTSPLFARGLPQQIPAQHGLMHPFFGIQVAGYRPSVSTCKCVCGGMACCTIPPLASACRPCASGRVT